jgi:hypothetical protein
LRLRTAALALAGLVALGCSNADVDTEHEAIGSPVIGGVDMHTADLDAVGALVGNEGAYCTATLIAPNVVLTAKHCTTAQRFRRFAIGPDANAPLREVEIKRTVQSKNDGTGLLGFGPDVMLHVLAESIYDVEPLAFAKDTLDVADEGAELTMIGYGLQVNSRTVQELGTRKGAKTTLVATNGFPLERLGGPSSCARVRARAVRGERPCPRTVGVRP